MAHVELAGVSKRFGPVVAIDDVSLAVEDGEFCALLGPSGCGKSTLLRVIAGLEAASEGRVLIDGVDVTEVPPAKRRIAMVFQSYALYPHMTVRQNISFGLEMARLPKDRIAGKVDAVARMLQLGELLERRPGQLSGGQRQRVAIGRALVRDPEVFLFDEPLSNLDAMLRVQMRVELSNLHQQLGSTMIYVTHDQVEAMTLANRIVVLDNGQISQIGTPLELYRHPANKFVASFIGSPGMNFLPIVVKDDSGPDVRLQVAGGTALQIPKRDAKSTSTPVELGVRPEHVRLGEPGSGDFNGEVFMVEHLGNTTVVHVRIETGHIVAQQDGESPVQMGDSVGLKLAGDRAHIFAASSWVV